MVPVRQRELRLDVLVEQMRKTAELLATQSKDGGGNTTSGGNSADQLSAAVEKLELCLDLANNMINRFSFLENVQTKDTEGAGQATMEHKVQINCSQCDGERYVEGAFCRHCWDHIRRIKMTGILDS